MIRTFLMVSLLAVPAVAQTPPPKKEPDKKPAAKAPTFEEIVAAAVNASPEVKIAEAEVAMAAAKLNAAKLAAAQKVTALKDSLDQAKAEIAAAQATLDMNRAQYDKQRQLVEKLRAGGGAPVDVLTIEKTIHALEADVQKSKAALTIAATRLNRMESDWKRFRDEVPPSPMLNLAYRQLTLQNLAEPVYLEWALARNALAGGAPAAEGPQADLRAALDKKVVFKGFEGDIPRLTAHLMKDAGYAGHVKYPQALNPAIVKDPPKVFLQSGEMTLGSWLQLLADEVSDSSVLPGGGDKVRYDFYVRDYGLQLATKETAAPGAIPLSTFWKTPKAKKD